MLNQRGKKSLEFLFQEHSDTQLVVAWTLSAIKHTVLDANVRCVLSELKSESLRQTKAAAERSDVPTRFSSLPVTPWRCRDKENGPVVPEHLL